MKTSEAIYTQVATAAHNEYVIDLGAIEAGTLPVVGGKAANLGKMIRAGFPVPPGFCVTTAAYAQVAGPASIDFDALRAAGTSESERLAGMAREALLGAAMPQLIAAAVGAAYQRLGEATPVAVRSSATAEDLPNASFAGQQDTYLNVIGTGAVLDAVQRCWASLWTRRAVVYRATNGIDHQAVRLAVVVQRMVDAEVAGVLFTANPITGKRRQAVIEASPGLGEAVVSGTVNPDQFVVDTASGQILERRIGDKRFEVRSTAGGGTRHVHKEAGAELACIDDAQVRALAALGDRVEAHFGAPQDTEWAIDSSGALWLTQARPITTLFPVPAHPGGKAAEFGVYFCFSVAQGLYRPITPMGLAGFRIMASATAKMFGIPVKNPLNGAPVYAEGGQRMFIDLTSTLRGRVGRVLFPKVLDAMEARSAVILRGLWPDPRLAPRVGWWPFARRVLRIAVRYGIPPRVLHALLRPQAAVAGVERIRGALAARLSPPQGATPRERLNFIERTLATEVVGPARASMPAAAAGLAMFQLAGKLLGGDATSGELEAVLRGLPHNVTTEMDLALWRLAGEIRHDAACARLLLEQPAADLARCYRDRTLPPVAQAGIARFLSTYGHRGVAEIDIGMPRWSDDPSYIFGVLANYLRLEDPEMAPDAVFARGAAGAEAMAATLVQRARRRGWLHGKLVAFALHRARQLAGLREMPKFYAIVTLAAVRRQLAMIGAELAREERIESADDIFLLDLVDVRAAIGGADLRARVADRRESYQTELRRRHVPSVILSDGTEPEAARAPDADSAELTGTPASAGTVTGIARVILDPVGAHIEPGEILVAPSTDPGWTPLFLTAGGLVMQMGGANSHGAVVAREYGIPAVVGVPNATLRIANGQRIAVDGTSGTVNVLS